MGTFGLCFGIFSCLGRGTSLRGSDDTLVGPLGHCVGARDRALFVCSVLRSKLCTFH